MSVVISSRRQEFSIFVVERDAKAAITLIETLKNVGYQGSRFYPTLASAQTMIESEAPHVIVVDHEAFESELETFLQGVKARSPETRIILMTTSRRFFEAVQLIGRGLAYDLIARPFSTSLELLQKVDRTCETLFYFFENEQLRERLSDENLPDLVRGSISSEPAGAPSDLEALHVSLERFVMTKDLDQTIQIFVEGLSQLSRNTPIAFFRYVPSHMSLLFSQSAWLPGEKFRGLGLDLKKEELSDLPRWIENPGDLAGIKKMVRDVFGTDRFTAFTPAIEGEALGVVIALAELEMTGHVGTSILRRAFEMAYKRNLTIKEKHLLDHSDPLTGLVNRRQLAIRLEQEMARARRIFMPVSLITLSVDGFRDLARKIGTQESDALLKTIAAILKRTTRLNDILARTGPEEFACVLPHTGYEGAAIKAERLRILMESSKVPLLEGLGLGALRMSIGVSEYPSFCSDGEGLVQSADEALAQVRSRGGNRVCLAIASPGFQKDFEPIQGSDSSEFGVRMVP